ncbi:hypothetical protein [uncultured Paraglaciecola sp.]|uniref:hypothetical protein n=1 Tax=uncultured Paraglaciecola sp. TaxID=1765024 RepID=UPI0030D986B4|tara:strand:- start:30715 stop:31428 length:714 start_codon:yes stop_codon:yes gene_type:complete
MFPSVLDSPAKKPNIIQATLVFDLPPLPKESVEVIEDETPQPVEPQKKVPVAEPPEESLIEPVVEPEIQLPPLSLPKPKPEETLPQETELNDKVTDIIISDKETLPLDNAEMSSSASSMVRRHLNSFQQLQQNRVAEQASRNYQNRKNSPDINSEVQNPFMTEDEKLRDSLKVRADCSSASKQTTAVVLGFLGAQIDCSKPPPITGFIQDRINKTSHLPSQHQQKNKKRPQSVVIKN